MASYVSPAAIPYAYVRRCKANLTGRIRAMRRDVSRKKLASDTDDVWSRTRAVASRSHVYIILFHLGCRRIIENLPRHDIGVGSYGLWIQLRWYLFLDIIGPRTKTIAKVTYAGVTAMRHSTAGNKDGPIRKRSDCVPVHRGVPILQYCLQSGQRQSTRLELLSVVTSWYWKVPKVNSLPKVPTTAGGDGPDTEPSSTDYY